MWISITYLTLGNKKKGHTCYIANKRQFKELAIRYNIRPEDLLSVETSKEHTLEEVTAWIS